MLALLGGPALARHADVVAQESTSPVFALDPNVTPPVVVSRVDPLFPVETSAKREVREVWLEGVVEADGTMSGLHVSMGINAEFNRRALEAASKWKFKPGTSKQTNQPVRAQVQLIVTFMPPQPAGAAATEEFGKGAHKQGEPGLVMPVVKKRVDPNYPKAAMKAKVQGEVEVEAVVLEDGTIGDVRVTKALDAKFGLDESAVLAVKRWVFEPATLHGSPVSAICTMTLEFRLR